MAPKEIMAFSVNFPYSFIWLHWASLVVTHGLSCPLAYGILVFPPRIKTASPDS